MSWVLPVLETSKCFKYHLKRYCIVKVEVIGAMEELLSETVFACLGRPD